MKVCIYITLVDCSKPQRKSAKSRLPGKSRRIVQRCKSKRCGKNLFSIKSTEKRKNWENPIFKYTAEWRSSISSRSYREEHWCNSNLCNHESHRSTSAVAFAIQDSAVDAEGRESLIAEVGADFQKRSERGQNERVSFVLQRARRW